MIATETTGFAFGIRFLAARALTEMARNEEAIEFAESATIEWREPRELGSNGAGAGPWLDERGVFHLEVRPYARFEVTSKSILVFPAPGASERNVRAFLFGSAIGALLQLQGLTVLHASAIGLPDGGAAVFCGPSTAGKSTLAAALGARGYPALADDLTAIRLDGNGQGWCLPGLARTKLWRDALQHLGLEHRAGDDTRVVPELDKHALPVTTHHAPMPLRRLYELQALDGDELAMTPLTGVAKLHSLVSQAYRPQFLLAMGRQGAFLRAAATLAPHLLAHRIVRPRQGQTLDAIVARLEAQWQA
jgi:hypothetical protein